MNTHDTCKAINLALNAATIELTYALADPEVDKIQVMMTAAQGVQQLVSQLNDFTDANPVQVPDDQQELDLTAAPQAE